MLKSIPSLTLTSTLTFPSVPANLGAIQVATVDVTKRAPAPVTVLVPNLQTSPSLLKLAPTTLTATPPETGPRLGETPETAGASKYWNVNPPSSCLPSCRKTTVTSLKILNGVVHTTVESFLKLPDTASAPKMQSVRVAPPAKLLPVTVTTLPIQVATVDVTKRAPAPVTVLVPNLQTSPSLLKLAPTTLTATPPETGPRLGETPETAGASKYWNVNPPSSCLPSCRKTTVTSLKILNGVVHTTVESFLKLPDTASAPKMQSVRVAPPAKLLPVTVTTLPPFFGPLVGFIALMLPPAPYVNPARPVPASTPLLLTTIPTVPAPREGAMHVTSVDDM